MNPRSKKYYENRKAQKGDKKGSVSEAGYNEQQTKTQSKKNPAPSKQQDQPKAATRAEQDDTGGGNDSGKRTDDN
jgi:hypothetical protein